MKNPFSALFGKKNNNTASTGAVSVSTTSFDIEGIKSKIDAALGELSAAKDRETANKKYKEVESELSKIEEQCGILKKEADRKIADLDAAGGVEIQGKISELNWYQRTIRDRLQVIYSEKNMELSSETMLGNPKP